MFAPLVAVGVFLKDNLKWVAIIAALIVFSVIGWKFYDLVNENADQRAKITQLEADIVLKDLTIELKQQNFKLSQDVVRMRDAELRMLEEQTSNLYFELPDDEDDLAPESTREFLNRLKGFSK